MGAPVLSEEGKAGNDAMMLLPFCVVSSTALSSVSVVATAVAADLRGMALLEED